MITKELKLIYSSRERRTLFLMESFPKELSNCVGQYILVGDGSSRKKELFYIGLMGKPITVALNDIERFEKTLNAIKRSQDDDVRIKLTQEQLNTLITSNGGHVPHGLVRLLYLSKLSNDLVELTPSKKQEEITTTPLLKTPPPGFQQLGIEFPLRKLHEGDLKYYHSKVHDFLNYLKTTHRADALKNAIRISVETYHLLKPNGNPSQPLCLMMKNSKKTYFQELQDKGWEIIRIYGHEKPAIRDIIKVPRAYLAIQPKYEGIRKIIIGFMGTEVFPRFVEETWWSNDRSDQPEIWGKSNFFHSTTRHTGVTSYGKIIISAIEKELNYRISAEEMRTIHFELTGHSSGGMLATLLALHLRTLSPASIHAFLFATPSFMTREQGIDLSQHFPNNSRYSLHNIIAHDDPAMNIYGRSFAPPESHTVYITPKDCTDSFVGVYAASKRTTLAHIEHHAHGNYQNIVTKLLEQLEEALPSSELPISYIPSKL